MSTSLQLVTDQVVTDTPISNLDTLSDDLLSGNVAAATDLARLFSDSAFVEASRLANPPAEVIATTSDAATNFVVQLAPDVANDSVAFEAFLTANQSTLSQTDSISGTAALSSIRIFPKRIHIIIGTVRNDILIGKATHDYIFGLDGNDLLSGQGGKDLLFGGNGNDILIGGTGNDTLFGENGDDKYSRKIN